tara:strand:+ start:941 stop:2500 length:1560 start_codon:yes stop_codon:yes gene_type:complete
MNKEKIKSKIQALYNHYNAGNYLYVIKNAEIILRKIPNNFFLMNLVGSCFQKIGYLERAKKIFEDVIALDSSNTAALNNLGNTYKKLKNYKSAEETYKKTLQIDPKFSNTLLNYGNLKFELNEYDEAINLLNKAIDIDTNNYLIYYNLGLVYQALGNFTESRKCLEKVISLNPSFANADKILSRFTKYKKDDPHIKNMEERLKNLKLSNFNKANILFSLGKVYEDIQEFNTSFQYLEEANNLLKKINKYDFKHDENLFKNLEESFSDVKFDLPMNDYNGKKYIFIVGLPRSGTSLTEQILSSHSLVYGAGELPHLADAIRKEFFKDKKLLIKDKILIEDKNILNKVGSSFEQNVNEFRFAENNLTDKNPLNFLWIGFIRLIFPNSKIIHVKRNLKDNYFSLYKNVFDGNMNWCYDKSDLFNYCFNYKKLMKFWHIKIPNFILDVEYENIISDTKNEVQKMLSFCNLSWEENCLHFYKTKRAIKTVSSAQARQPIYKSSLKTYENYEKYLNEYFNKLEKI